ncbi:dienelactone hydrolase family protein [Streptomyces sp. MCAF7]
MYVFAPDDATHPDALMYADAFDIRPPALGMGWRLAEYGYVVLVPDVFCRAGAHGPLKL